MKEALVGGEGRVVQAPVGKVIVGGVAVPVGGREVEGELHPVPLRLVVAELGRRTLTGVGAHGDQHADEERGERDQNGRGDRRCRWVPRKPNAGYGRIWSRGAGFPRLRHRQRLCGSRRLAGRLPRPPDCSLLDAGGRARRGGGGGGRRTPEGGGDGRGAAAGAGEGEHGAGGAVARRGRRAHVGEEQKHES